MMHKRNLDTRESDTQRLSGALLTAYACRASKNGIYLSLYPVPVPHLDLSLRLSGALLRAYACRVQGEVQVGHGSILYPRCTVFAAPGACVVIGAKTIIEELVEITCNRGTVTIGERCLLQVGSRCERFPVQIDTARALRLSK